MAYSKVCECGKVIEGLSESQMNYNYNLHKKSKKHKRVKNATNQTIPKKQGA